MRRILQYLVSRYSGTKREIFRKCKLFAVKQYVLVLVTHKIYYKCMGHLTQFYRKLNYCNKIMH
jgi:hypothetical protein